MRLSKALCSLAFLSLGVPVLATDPPGIAVAESEPHSSAPAGVITCAAGRFVPLAVSGGKPTLLLGNEAGLVEIYPLAKGESINGVRYDEPAGAKTKRYTFPKGATHYAVAGDVGGTVTLTAVVNGTPDKDKNDTAPTVAGKLVLTLTAPMPPPPPPVTRLTLTAYPNAGDTPLSTVFTATGLDTTVPFSLSFGDGSPQVMTLPAPHTYTAAGTFTATVAQGSRTATAVVTVTGTPIPPPPPVTSFRVIMVSESGKTLPAQQNSVWAGKAVEDYLIKKTTPENGLAGFRRFDPQQVAEVTNPLMGALWAAVKPQITTVPCFAIEKNGKVDIVPFPANPTDALKLLKTYAGE